MMMFLFYVNIIVCFANANTKKEIAKRDPLYKLSDNLANDEKEQFFRVYKLPQDIRAMLDSSAVNHNQQKQQMQEQQTHGSLKRHRRHIPISASSKAVKTKKQPTTTVSTDPWQRIKDSKPPPTRVTFAEMLTTTNAFVDKSLFIEEFLSAPIVSLITRPRRWGKTINLEMLKAFLEVEIDAKGKPLTEDNRFNRKLFLGGQIRLQDGTTKVLQPLKIANCTDIVKDYHGKFPVIFISFNDIDELTYQKIEDRVRQKIVDLFHEHYYLRDILTIDIEKNRFETFYKGNSTTEKLVDGLWFLSVVMQEYYSRDVFILMDEYDQPINHLYLHLMPESKKQNVSVHELPEFRRAFQLVRGMVMLTFKGNHNLEKGLITGIIPFTRGLFFSTDNIAYFNFKNEKFATSFGFTESEVTEIVESSAPNSYDADRMKQMYDGYKYYDQVLYNPASVIKYLYIQVFDYYWLKCGGTQLIDTLLVSDWFEDSLKNLIGGGNVTATINPIIHYDHLTTVDGFVNVLVLAGYLSPASKRSNRFRIPNEEVHALYETKYNESIIARKRMHY